MMFMGVMMAIGSVKPLSQPATPLFLMLLYQMMAVTIKAQTSVQLKSAVEERRNPVMPIRDPKREERNRVRIKGVQCSLWAPMVLTTISRSIKTPFSTKICRGPGRVDRFFPRAMQKPHTRMVTSKEETVVWVMLMPPKIGMVK